MRLYDRLRRETIMMLPPDSVYTPPTNNTLRYALDVDLPRAVCLHVQNVVDYATGYQELNGDIPEAVNCQPAWPVTWLEYHLDDTNFGVLSTDAGVDASSGALVQEHLVFVEPGVNKGNRQIYFAAVVESLCDAQGAAIPVAEDGAYFRLIGKTPEGEPHSFNEKVIKSATSAAHITLLSMTFAHCKNVSVQEHRTPPKVAKKRAKAGKPIGTTYKTLVIDPMREVLKTEGNIEKNGLKKALHICRGHFATYTEDKPLFGKVTGTFWKPMHTRGSAKQGRVIKDYEIRPKTN